MNYSGYLIDQDRKYTRGWQGWHKEEKRNSCLMGTEFLFEMMQKFGKEKRECLYKNANICNATELYT